MADPTADTHSPNRKTREKSWVSIKTHETGHRKPPNLWKSLKAAKTHDDPSRSRAPMHKILYELLEPEKKWRNVSKMYSEVKKL